MPLSNAGARKQHAHAHTRAHARAYRAVLCCTSGTGGSSGTLISATCMPRYVATRVTSEHTRSSSIWKRQTLHTSDVNDHWPTPDQFVSA